MQASTVGLQIIVTTPAAECLKVQTWPSVSVASHFWLLLDLHLPRDAMQPCLVCITASPASLR